MEGVFDEVFDDFSSILLFEFLVQFSFQGGCNRVIVIILLRELKLCREVSISHLIKTKAFFNQTLYVSESR